MQADIFEQQKQSFFSATAQFYPTPRHVLDRMGIDADNRICYEPSAGKGDIVDYLKEFGAAQVIASEINNDLRAILAAKCTLIGDDFFNVTAEQISHINLIVMNPPFSNAEKHITHAWEIAPEGCEIIALCNSETVNRYHRHEELHNLINTYGNTEDLGDCFSTAERKTNVNIALVRLFKPVISEKSNWEGFYFTEEEEAQENAAIPYNEIRAIVNSYVAAVRCFDKVEAVSKELRQHTDVTIEGGIGEDGERKQHQLTFGEAALKFEVGYNKTISTKEEFAKAYQKRCWRFVFSIVNIEKYVTSGVMRDINDFVESREKYPFTMRNVYKMLEIIAGTRESIMNRAIVEAVDTLTKYTDENRYGLPGWKTNAGHLLNQKFIVDWMIEYRDCNTLNPYGIRYNSNYMHIVDLIKALCHITGTNFSGTTDLRDYFHGARRMQTNTWYDLDFFEFKFFKKGTMHFKFKDLKIWEQLNRTYAKIKGEHLPEKL